MFKLANDQTDDNRSAVKLIQKYVYQRVQMLQQKNNIAYFEKRLSNNE